MLQFLPLKQMGSSERQLLCYPNLPSYKFYVNVLSILFKSMVGGFSVLFPQLWGKCQGKARKDGARPNFCVVLCIVCVYMYTVRLPPAGYPIAVKYIIPYQWDVRSSVDVIGFCVDDQRAKLNFRQDLWCLHKNVGGRGDSDGANICAFIEICIFYRYMYRKP